MHGAHCSRFKPSVHPVTAVLARDPQSVVVYDSSGSFVGVRRPGSGKPLAVEGLNIVIEDVVGSTGLELKHDPGVPWVYAGEEQSLRESRFLSYRL